VVPKWAEDLKEFNQHYLQNQKENEKTLKSVFGSFKVEGLELGLIFQKRKKSYDVRGSSANWKNEQYTPDSYATFSNNQSRKFKTSLNKNGSCK
jgi:hypothetical protein